MTNRLCIGSPLIQAKRSFEAKPLEIFANTGHTRTLDRSIDGNNSTRRRHHHSSSVIESSRGDSPRVSAGLLESIAQEQHHFPAQSIRSACVPLSHRNPAWNVNEQDISSECIYPPDSGPKQSYPSQALQLQQHSKPLVYTDAGQSNSKGSREPIAHEDIMAPQDPYNVDLQEEVSKGSFNEIEQDSLERTDHAGFQVASPSEVENRFFLPIPSRVPSRAPSEAPSRPQSRRSNYGKPLTRPVPLQDLRPQGVLESLGQQRPNSAKFKKSSNATNDPVTSEVLTQPAGTRQDRQKARPSPGFFNDYKKFLANGQEYLEAMQDYERQSQLVESQKAEIEKLRDISDFSVKQIQALESEKGDLTEKLKKFTELSSKYKKHMNEVVKAQKYLKIQASEIQKKAAEAIEARNVKETVLQKLESAIMDAKSLRVPAEKFAYGKCWLL
jgi:hypothetical protein